MAEIYGTIWVCVCCMFMHANGECCADDEHGGDGIEPLSSIEPPYSVTMGMAYEEHAEDCARHPLECTECTNPAEIAVWWENPDGTHEGEPRCINIDCMGSPADAVAGGTTPIPAPFPVPDDYECDCETDTFSTSQCQGCGSWLHGDRHAMTLWKEDTRSVTPETQRSRTRV